MRSLGGLTTRCSSADTAAMAHPEPARLAPLGRAYPAVRAVTDASLLLDDDRIHKREIANIVDDDLNAPFVPREVCRIASTVMDQRIERCYLRPMPQAPNPQGPK